MRIKITTTRIAIASLLLVVVAACSYDNYVASNEVSTRQIFATFQIVDEGGDQIFAEAQLTRDLPPNQPNNRDTFVKLESDDQLWLSAGEHFSQVSISDDLFGGLKEFNETQIQMRATQEILYTFLFGTINYDGDRYAARLPHSENGQYQVALIRQHHTDATESTITMPIDFELSAPLASDTYSRSNDIIQIDWAPVEENVSIKVEIKTSCLNDGFHSYLDTVEMDEGRHTIDAGVLEGEGHCTSVINLVKSRLGSFDSAFTGGRVAGHQIRSVAINTTD